MECLTPESEIKRACNNIRFFSFAEKTNPLQCEDQINDFLDTILEFKKSLNEKTQKLFEINGEMERLTWFNDLNKECLMLINDLIASAKDLHSALIRQYVRMNYIRAKGVAKHEIKDFKNSIDELKETYIDLESVFFYLPEIPDFVETTKQLSLV